MTNPTRQLTERNSVDVPIKEDEITHININCPHCGWRTKIWAAKTNDDEIAVVAEGLCGHAGEQLEMAAGTPILVLTFTEDCSYGNVHKLPSANKSVSE